MQSSWCRGLLFPSQPKLTFLVSFASVVVIPLLDIVMGKHCCATSSYLKYFLPLFFPSFLPSSSCIFPSFLPFFSPCIFLPSFLPPFLPPSFPSFFLTALFLSGLFFLIYWDPIVSRGTHLSAYDGFVIATHHWITAWFPALPQQARWGLSWVLTVETRFPWSFSFPVTCIHGPFFFLAV